RRAGTRIPGRDGARRRGVEGREPTPALTADTPEGAADVDDGAAGNDRFDDAVGIRIPVRGAPGGRVECGEIRPRLPRDVREQAPGVYSRSTDRDRIHRRVGSRIPGGVDRVVGEDVCDVPARQTTDGAEVAADVEAARPVGGDTGHLKSVRSRSHL